MWKPVEPMSDTATRDPIERVAMAIFAADGTDSDWKWEDGRWERERDQNRYRRLARAAIKAMT